MDSVIFYGHFLNQQEISDPSLMEAKDGSVVDFKHVLEHIKNIHPTTGDEVEFAPDELKVGNFRVY